MHPYTLRLIIAVGTASVALLAIFIIEYTGINVDRFAGAAQTAGAFGLLFLVVIAIADAVGWLTALNRRLRPTFASALRSYTYVRLALRLSLLPRVVAIALLLTANNASARDYFVLLRWFVAGCAALTMAIAWRSRQSSWIWVSAMVTVLFNPVAEIHLSRQTWAIVDLVVAVWFAVSLFAVREPRSPDAVA